MIQQIFPSPLFYRQVSYEHDPLFDAFDYPLFPYPDQTYVSHHLIAGEKIHKQPISEIPRKLTGAKVPFFFADYYNRVHIHPRIVNLGNILNTQTRQIEIWNAYLTPQTLKHVRVRNADGMVSDIEPTTFNTLASKNYHVTISEQGGASLDATLLLEFEDFTTDLRIIGNRVTLFPFVPKMHFTETYEWLTDVIRTFKGEQRFLLRATPRRTFDYDFVFNSLQFAKAKTVINQWANRLFALPVWYDKMKLDYLSKNATFIRLETKNAEYEAGGSLLVYENEDKYEVIEIDRVMENQIALKLPITRDYQNVYVMPIKLAYLNENRFNRMTNDIIEANLRFQVTDQSSLPSLSLKRYQGHDVLLDCPQINQSESLNRSAEVIDNHLSHILKFDRENMTRLSQMLSFFKKSRSDVFAFKQWLYTRQGRQKAFWLPSFGNDLHLTKTITSTETAMTVKNINFYLYGEKTHFMLATKNGTQFFGEIQSGQNNNDGTETLFFDKPMSQEITVDDVKSISFMNLVRLDSDRIEIEHLDFEMCRISFPVVNIPIPA